MILAQVPGATVIDLTGLAQAVIGGLIDAVKELVSPLPFDLEKFVLTSIQNILASQGAHNLLTHIPVEWSSQNADVLSLYRAILPVQAGLAAVVLMIQGYRVMQAQIDIWDATFRTGFFVILGISTAFWIDRIIVIINTASDAVSTSPLDIRRETLPNDLVLGFMLIVAGFVAALAWLKGAVGVIFIDVLIVTAPVFLTMAALPFFEGLGKWWAEEMTTWLLRPFMVALVLRLGLNLGVQNTGGLQLLFAIVAFWLAYTMDSRIRRFSVGAWGSISQVGMLTRSAQFAAAAVGGGASRAVTLAGATLTFMI